MFLTKHSVDQAKSRLGINRKALQRLADKAYDTGLTHSQVNGSLSRYMDRLWFHGCKTNNMRVYGEYIYLFAGETLITILKIPNKYKSYIKELKDERHK